MSFVAGALVPSAPLLVPALAGGSAGVDARLREAAIDAVCSLLAVPGAPVVVVGAASRTGPVRGTWDWSGFGVRQRGDAHAPALPLSLAVGAWLLDTCRGEAERSYVGVADAEDDAVCAALGRTLAEQDAARLLVVGDGSARRAKSAPGYLDPRAEPFDTAVERALAEADVAALAALDRTLSQELMVSGRAPWQVLAGAAAGRPWHGELLHADSPYGVSYIVARWSHRGP